MSVQWDICCQFVETLLHGFYPANWKLIFFSSYRYIFHVIIVKVGYPNVGKSSTINAILQSKKVPVSSTPGRTKHFQVLYIFSADSRDFREGYGEADVFLWRKVDFNVL